VYLLPFYNPLRLLEEICVLDHLTAGRLDIGVGKGVSPVEQRLWGLDSRVAREVFETHFQVLRDGLSANGVCAGEPVSVEARQAGGPPVWYPGNVEYAGSHRLNTIVGGPTSTLAGAVEAYRGFLQSAQTNWNPGVAEPIIGVTRHIYVAPTDELAWARVAQSFPRYHDNLTSLWKKYDEPLPTDPSVGGDTQFALGADLLVAGSPATVAAHIQAVNDVSGIDYFMAAFAWGDLTHEESMSSLELFTREVMPRFRS
jgi:alkanesulfonate monooxygenase SsuD/methylene tetrahydromethanopterin reductase-like flavin-dependent oxidoreductase (luciferase family)